MDKLDELRIEKAKAKGYYVVRRDEYVPPLYSVIDPVTRQSVGRAGLSEAEAWQLSLEYLPDWPDEGEA